MRAFRAKIKKHLPSRPRSGSPAARTLSDRIDMSVIRGIQEIAATPGCVIHAEFLGDDRPKFTKASNIALLESSDVRPVSENSLFAGGSFQKLFISVALYLIIEQGLGLDEQDASVRDIMNDAWGKKAFDVFNGLRKARGEPQLLRPMRSFTLKQMLQHENALPAHQRYLWGPESSFIFADKLFEETITGVTDMESESRERFSKYSNWNYILAGHIVKLACNTKTLADALYLTVFARFQICNTIVRAEDYEKRKDEIADAVATTLQKPAGFKVSTPEYFTDTSSLSCGGGYTCVEDIAKVLRWILQEMVQVDSKLHNLLQSSRIEDDNGFYTSTMFGIQTEVDSSATGSQSFDHKWQRTAYTLKKPQGGSFKVLSKAGAVHGFNAHFYLIPEARMFFIVMANSSGILDTSNHISHYLLHALFELPGKLPIIDHARHIRDQKLKDMNAKIGRAMDGRELNLSDLDHYGGSYIHKQSHLRLVIKKQVDQVYIYLEYEKGGRTRPLTIRIASNGDLFLSPRPEDDSIETYGSWQGYQMEVRKSDTTVTKLIGVAAMDEDERSTVFERE